MKYVVVRVRGMLRATPKVQGTLHNWKLDRTNAIAIIEANESTKGMLEVAKSYITWGELSPEVEKKLLPLFKDKKIIALNPPRKGYGRKGVKVPFSKGGAVGYRGEKITDLIERML